MAERAVFLADHEGVSCMCRRSCPADWRLDALKLMSYAESARPGRTLIWSTWIVPERPADDPCWSYYRFLEANGVRLEIVEPKPICRVTDKQEPNMCDFALVEAIHLAAAAADTLIIAAGDGHFRWAIRTAQQRFGRRVEVISDRKGLSSTISADHFHILEELIQTHDIQRREGGSNAKRGARHVYPGPVSQLITSRTAVSGSI